VFLFPKREKTPARTIEAPALTIPEFRPEMPPADDLVTEPNYLAGDSTSEGAGKATPPWPKRSTSGEARKAAAKKKDKKKRPASRRKRTTDKVPAVPVPKVAMGGAAAGAPQPSKPSRFAEVALHGHQLFEMGRLEEARRVFEDLVGMEPRDSFPHTMLGTIYLALGDQDRALALFEAALQIDPSELSALVYRGEIRLNQGKTKPALVDLNRAVSLGLGDDPFVDRARRLIRMAHDRAKSSKA
jgi:cytochrome c-type biogenesis protein CcmH/NrfG